MDPASLANAFDLVWPEDDLDVAFGLRLSPLSQIDDAQDTDEQMSKLAMEMFDFDSECEWHIASDGHDDSEVTKSEAQTKHRITKDRAVSMKSRSRFISKAATRTSKWKGVTKHKITLRWEAHLWDANFERRKSSKSGRQRGRQVYLGGWTTELEAARAYDLASLRYFGTRCPLNFPREKYKEEIQLMQEYTCADWVAEIRRHSSGFSRGVSAYRGVTSHRGKSKSPDSSSKGKWEARIGRVLGNKYLYLGTFPTERAAAEAYDCAAIRFRGPSKAVTNFDRSNYSEEDIRNAGLGAKIM